MKLRYYSLPVARYQMRVTSLDGLDALTATDNG